MDQNLEGFRKIDEIINNPRLLHVTADTVEETRNWMREVYRVTGYNGKEPLEERIQRILNVAVEGWGAKTPATFEARVTVKMGGNLISKYKSTLEKKRELELLGISAEEVEEQIRQINSKQVRNKRKRKDISAADIYLQSTITKKANANSLKNYLDKEEKEYWVQRELEYRKEFDFNDSSDKILLEEVLYNEVLLRRIRLAKMTGDEKRLESIKGLQEMSVIDNHRKLLEKLGVLRIQRIETDTNIEGNVGEIAIMLESKLTDIRNIQDKNIQNKTIKKIMEKYSYLDVEEIENIIEEQKLLNEVQKLGDLNPIPVATYQQIESSLVSKVEKQNVDGIDLDE